MIRSHLLTHMLRGLVTRSESSTSDLNFVELIAAYSGMKPAVSFHSPLMLGVCSAQRGDRRAGSRPSLMLQRGDRRAGSRPSLTLQRGDRRAGSRPSLTLQRGDM